MVSRAFDIGPCTIGVQVDRGPGDFFWELFRKRIEELLREISSKLPILRLKGVVDKPYFPGVVRRMIRAVSLIDPSLTPMASVAGAVSDELLELAFTYGIEGEVIVNNGGDISVFSPRGTWVGISVRPYSPPEFRVFLKERFGVSTSGKGGRSISLGVADAVFVVSHSAAVADAAATFVANNTVPENTERLLKIPAVELDPLTDIPEEQVVVGGELSEEDRFNAVGRGFRVLKRLVDRGLILGGAVFLRPFLRSYGLILEKLEGGMAWR